jgi:hypothetical protein
MENFKFYTDRTPLTPEEIHSHKNFNKVLEQYKNVPVSFTKTGWFKAGLATVTVVATGLTIFFATGPNKNEDSDKTAKAVTNQSPYADETPCVKSPTPNLDVPAVNYTVNTQRDTVLKYETGSVILFKANSLKDEKGNTIKGNVVIHYREFHNPVEIFVSGIPMQYDSANADWHLQSAGMIEITASQDGKPVFIAPEKAIDVQMKSDKTDGEYNVYFLDTTARNWAYKGVDNLISANCKQEPHTKKEIEQRKLEISKMKVDEAKIKKEMASEMPVRPKQASPGSFTFTLDVLESEFPELTVYGKTKFEVIDKEKSFTNQIYATEWEDAALKEVKYGEEYKITLTRGNIVKSFNATPVLDGKDLKLAMEVYAEKYKEYQEKLAGRISDEKAKIEAQKQELAQWEREANFKHKNRIQDFTASNLPDNVLARFASTNSAKQSLVTRAFSVLSFGIWNCDKPVDFPRGAQARPSFVDASGNPLNITTAYLCEKGSNAVYTIGFTNYDKFSFNPKEKNVIWGMLPDGSLAYGLEDVFATRNITGKKIRFVMNICNEQLTSVKQIQELFGI